jgi:predicted GIY-YIG superfamily endonuclease
MWSYEGRVKQQEKSIEKMKEIIYPVGYVYKLSCLNSGYDYFGSTNNLVNRLAKHKHKDNECVSKSIIEKDNYTFETVLTLHNISLYDLVMKEKWFIQNNPCINNRTPLPTLEEMKGYDKEYYEENKERFNEKINCECGGRYTTKHKTRHLKSKIHTEWVSKNCQISSAVMS